MEFIRPSGNSAHKMADTSTLDDLRDILLHPGDFKQTIETTYNLCISQTVSKNEIINIINETKGDVSQKSIALWVYNKMYPKEDKDQVENEDKENANPNVDTKNIQTQNNLQKTPKYTLINLNTLFDIEKRPVLRNFSINIENNIDNFITQVFVITDEPTLRSHIEGVIKESKTYITAYPHFTFFIRQLLYDRLINLMDRLTVMNVMKKNKDMIDYWNSLISQFIDENLKEFRNLEIDPIKSVTPYAINGGRLRKIKKTKKKRLHKRKQSRNRKQSRKR